MGPANGREDANDRERPCGRVERHVHSRLEAHRFGQPRRQDQLVLGRNGQTGPVVRHAREIHLEHRLRKAQSFPAGLLTSLTTECRLQSPDGRFVASGAIDGIINVFDVSTGKLVHTLEGHAMPIRSLAFSHSSQLLLTASDDGQIKIYDV